MSNLSRRERLKILGMVTEIAAEAAGNQNIVWMIEFQEELVTRLYSKFCDLISSTAFDDDESEEEVEKEDEEEEEEEQEQEQEEEEQEQEKQKKGAKRRRRRR